MVSFDPYTAQQPPLEMNSLKPLKPQLRTPAEEAFELEKSHITSYEENWDRWDGPIWPLGTIQCSLQNPNCHLAPCPEHHPTQTTTLSPADAAFEEEKSHITSYEEGWDRWDGPVWPLGTVQCDLQRPNCTLSLCAEHHPTATTTTTTTSSDAAFEAEKAAVTSYEEGWDRWDGPVWPLGTVQCELQSPRCVLGPCPEHCPVKKMARMSKA